MSAPTTILYFDFVDPVSYLLAREIEAVTDGAVAAPPAWVGFELRPPPAPLVLLDDASVAAPWARARALADELGVELAPPRLVPWSRKAHELHLHAAEHGCDRAVRSAIFEAYHLRGRDIGRVDVLVEIGAAAGLDRTETKAILDVDRQEAGVVRAREEAERAGIVAPPVLVRGERRLQGFHNRTTLGTFLRDSPGGGDG